MLDFYWGLRADKIEKNVNWVCLSTSGRYCNILYKKEIYAVFESLYMFVLESTTIFWLLILRPLNFPILGNFFKR